MRNTKSTIIELKERREQILSHLYEEENHTSTVKALAQLFNISEMTIRRDLNFLENYGFIERFHGGAKLISNLEIGTYKDNAYNKKIKKEIAFKAAEFIKDNSTIYINSGDTALNVVDYLNDLTLVIVSNNLNLHHKDVHPNITTILTGGEIREPRDVLVGDLAVNSLENIHADVSILSCSGISAENGFSTNNLHEARVNRMMINNSKQLVILLADHEKVGKSTNFIVDDLSSIDLLITDVYADNEEIRRIEGLGIQVIQVDI